MRNLPVISMNAGKVTPLIDCRSDTEKYSSACRILENMIPRIYGPVERRPGTKYIADVDDSDKKSKVVPFIYSATIAYDIEFADQIINVYYDGSLVDSDIATPYLEADLFELQFKQSADVMWIVHPSYRPRKLTRTSATEFSLDVIDFETGPFLERNDIKEDDGVTIAVTGYTIATATLGGAGAGEFTISSTTDISSLFPANQRFYVTNSTGNDGAYTVSSATYAANILTIVPNEAVADGTDDGQIMVDGGTVTLTASDDTFTTGDSGHIYSLWKLTHKREKTVSRGNAEGTGQIGEIIDVKGEWSFTTHGNWDAVVEIQRMEDGVNWETFRTYTSVMDSSGKGSRNIQKTDIEDADGVQYRIYVSSYENGKVEADLTVDNSTQDSIFKITSVTSATVATATAIVAANEHTATKRWAEGAWSYVRGWPSAFAFFEERAVYGFTNLDAQDIWLSGSGDFEDFASGTEDDDAFTLTLPTANRGRWLGSMEVLAAGTTGDEWRIRSTTIDEALTPTNWSIKQQTNFGSANIQAVEVNDAIIFVDSVARKAREYTWSDPKQKYVSPDLTALAEDITYGGITSMAVQKNPDSIIWFTIENSPYLISMTYEREQKVVAWAEHPLGGDGIAESISIRPGTDEDVITLTVRRTINGSTVRYIEEMQPRDFGSTTDPTDAFFVDCGIIDEGGDTTIDGLDHLEDETVAVLGDGSVQISKKVKDGEITIDSAADKVIVGLPYTYQVSPMRLDIMSGAGTTHGSIKKIPEIIISFYATSGAQYGDGNDTYDIDWRTSEEYDSPPELFTGDKTLHFDGGFSIEDNFIVSGSDPLPCTVRAMVPRAEITGR